MLQLTDTETQRFFDQLCQTQQPAGIVICGGSCSGKTTLATQLAEKFALTHLELDWFYRTLSDPRLPRDTAGHPLFDTPEAYDAAAFVETLEQLWGSICRGDGAIHATPNYDKVSGFRLTEPKTVTAQPAGFVCEGLFVTQFLREQPFAANFCFLYLDVPEALLENRRMKRDAVFFGVSEDRVQEVYRQKVLPAHRHFVQPQKQQSTVCVTTEAGKKTRTNKQL